MTGVLLVQAANPIPTDQRFLSFRTMEKNNDGIGGFCWGWIWYSTTPFQKKTNINWTLLEQKNEKTCGWFLSSWELGFAKFSSLRPSPNTHKSTVVFKRLSLYSLCTHSNHLWNHTHGYGSKNPLDRPAVIRTSGTRGLRKGAWSRGLQDPEWYDMKCLRESVAERSGIETARPAIVFTLGFNLTLSTLGTGRHEFQISWIVNQQLEEGRKPNNHKY